MKQMWNEVVESGGFTSKNHNKFVHKWLKDQRSLNAEKTGD